MTDDDTVAGGNRSKEIPVETTTKLESTTTEDDKTTTTESIPESEQDESRMMITLRSFKLTPATTTVSPAHTTTTPQAHHHHHDHPHHDTATRSESTSDEMPREVTMNVREERKQPSSKPAISTVIDEVHEHQEKTATPIPPYSKDDNDYVPDSPIHLNPQASVTPAGTVPTKDEALEELEAELDIEKQQKRIVELRRREKEQKEKGMRNSSVAIESEDRDVSSTPRTHTFPSEQLNSEEEELRRAEEKERRDKKVSPSSLRVSLSSPAQIPEAENEEATVPPSITSSTASSSKTTTTEEYDSAERALARMDSAEIRVV